MNKQIEVRNMAEILCDARHKFVYSDELAEYLYNKDYRKASDVAREIFEEIEKLKHTKWDWNDVVEWDAIARLKKKYESEGADDEQTH